MVNCIDCGTDNRLAFFFGAEVSAHVDVAISALDFHKSNVSLYFHDKSYRKSQLNVMQPARRRLPGKM